MKKLVSLLTVVCMLLACVCQIGVYADGTTTDTTIRLPFEDDFTGRQDSITAGWVLEGGNPRIDKNIINVTSHFISTQNVLWIWATNNDFGLNFETPITTGKLAVSYDIDLNGLVNSSYTASEQSMGMFFGKDKLVEGSAYSGTEKAAAVRVVLDKSGTKDKSSRFEKGWGLSWSDLEPKIVTETGWNRVDVVLDMDAKSVTTYIDGVLLGVNNCTKDYSFPESISSVYFDPNLGNHAVFLDNFKIVQNPVMQAEKFEVNAVEKYIDVTYNYAISALPTTSDVELKSVRNQQSATVTEVKSVEGKDNVLRIKYDNDTTGGGYTLSINNVASLFAGTAAWTESKVSIPIAVVSEDFSSVSYDSSTGKINDWLSVTKANLDKIAIDTSDGKLKITSTDPASWSNILSIGVTNVNDFLAPYKAIRVSTGEDKGEFKNSTTHTGKLAYEFDLNVQTNAGTVLWWSGDKRVMRINASTGGGLHVGHYGVKHTTGTPVKDAEFISNTEYRVKIEYNFEEQKIKYYLDGVMVAEPSFSDVVFGETKSNIENDNGYLVSLGLNKGSTATLDNLCVTYCADDVVIQNADIDSDDKLTAQLVNPFNVRQNATIFYAAYDSNNNLVWADAEDASAEAYTQKDLSKEIAVPEGIDYASVKVYVWDTVNGYRPLCSPIK